MLMWTIPSILCFGIAVELRCIMFDGIIILSWMTPGLGDSDGR
jgi:hypothetical protein